MKEKKKKVKVVYYEDKGETIYPMAATYGLTPEELEKQKEAEKNASYATGIRGGLINSRFHSHLSLK